MDRFGRTHRLTMGKRTRLESSLHLTLQVVFAGEPRSWSVKWTITFTSAPESGL